MHWGEEVLLEINAYLGGENWALDSDERRR